MALKDSSGGGRADVVQRFGPAQSAGAHGGTGIALYQGALYVEESDRIERYRIPAGALTSTEAPEVIVSGCH